METPPITDYPAITDYSGDTGRRAGRGVGGGRRPHAKTRTSVCGCPRVAPARTHLNPHSPPNFHITGHLLGTKLRGVAHYLVPQKQHWVAAFCLIPAGGLLVGPWLSQDPAPPLRARTPPPRDCIKRGPMGGRGFLGLKGKKIAGGFPASHWAQAPFALRRAPAASLLLPSLRLARRRQGSSVP